MTNPTQTSIPDAQPKTGRKPKRLNCPFKTDDRVKVLQEHDGNKQAVGQIGHVVNVYENWDRWWVNVELVDHQGAIFKKGAKYRWIFPIEKVELAPYTDGLDNWE